MRLDKYQYLGIGLASFGVPFGLFSYFILLSVPLAAFGLACIVLGGTLYLVPPSPLPARHLRAMLEGSLVNVEALLEEFDVQGRAIYLAPRDDRVAALVPRGEVVVLGDLDRVPRRVLTRVDGVDCVLVFPPGSEIVRLALLPEDIGLEDGLSLVLVDFLEIVDGVKVVQDMDQVIVELKGVRAGSEMPRVNHSLGSLAMSVSGCVLASVLGKPVVFQLEETLDGKVSAVFGVLV